MKPFDLEKALAGETVVTRDGHPVSHLTRIPGVTNDFKLVGVLLGSLEMWTIHGRFFCTPDKKSEWDLFMADKPKRTVRAYVRVQKKASRLQTPHCTTTALEIGEDEAIEPCDGWQTVEFDLEVEE